MLTVGSTPTLQGDEEQAAPAPEAPCAAIVERSLATPMECSRASTGRGMSGCVSDPRASCHISMPTDQLRVQDHGERAVDGYSAGQYSPG